MSSDDIRDKLDELMQGQARLAQQVMDVKSSADSSLALLQGDGGNDKPGIAKRVDRLEQGVGRAMWVVGTIIATAVGLMTNAVWNWFKAGKP